MKQRELFVGAIVCAESPSGICEAKEILSDHWIDTKGNRHDYERTEPIPLTEDIIEKQGFMRIKQLKCYFPHYWSFCKTNEDDEEAFDYTIRAYNSIFTGMKIIIRNCINDTNLSFQCESVHQLQQAFRLCGIDKEITL